MAELAFDDEIRRALRLRVRSRGKAPTRITVKMCA